MNKIVFEITPYFSDHLIISKSKSFLCQTNINNIELLFFFLPMKLNIFILFALPLLFGLVLGEEVNDQAEPGAVPMPKEPGVVPLPDHDAALPIEEPDLKPSSNKPAIETPGPEQFPEPPFDRPRPFPDDEEPPFRPRPPFPPRCRFCPFFPFVAAGFVGNVFTFQEHVLHVLITLAEDSKV